MLDYRYTTTATGETGMVHSVVGPTPGHVLEHGSCRPKTIHLDMPPQLLMTLFDVSRLPKTTYGYIVSATKTELPTSLSCHRYSPGLYTEGQQSMQF